MVKVMATGTFDLLHLGHIYYLKEAKKLGDQLIVIVARDSTVKKLKHEPINPEKIRLNLIKELQVVDQAYLGNENDRYKIVEKIKPDVIAIGYDQIHNEKEIESQLKKRNIDAKVKRLKEYNGGSDLEGTRKIINKIITAYEFQKNIERIEKK
ncbi:MAG: adenylyltransferase/cytidyltransferase family protein [Candidatus Thermoplasmatota archaeon]